MSAAGVAVTAHAEERALRVAELRRVVADGRLLRNRWHEERDGREYACLAVALAREAKGGDVGACPAWLLPSWMWPLLPWIDDTSGDDAEAARRALRVADLVERSGALAVEDWQRLGYTFLAIVVREAESHITVDKWGAKAAMSGVLGLLDRAATGGQVAAKHWDAAWDAAGAAAEAAAGAAGWAAAEAAAEAVAEAVAEAAAWAAAEAAAEAAAADRITAAFFDAWGQAIEGRQ